MKKLAITFFLMLSVLFAFNGKQVVFANSLPQNVRVVYNFTYIYSADETVVNSTPAEEREQLVLKVAYLSDVFKVNSQTNQMFEIEFEIEQTTQTGYIFKSVVIDNTLKSPEKYLQTNASITKQADVFKKEDDNFVLVQNIILEKGAKVRMLETLNKQNQYTLISFNHEDSTLVYYVKTDTLKADGINRSILTAITLMLVSVSLGSVLLTIFKRTNQRKQQALLEE